VEDDLFARRLRQHRHQTTAPRRDHDRFLPRLWTPEEAARVRVVLGGTRRRPWYRRWFMTSQVGVSNLIYPPYVWVDTPTPLSLVSVCECDN